MLMSFLGSSPHNSKIISFLTTSASFSLLGPVLVTKDAIQDPQVLGIKAIYNGSTVQDGSTKYVHVLIYPSLTPSFPRPPSLSPSYGFFFILL